MCGRGVDFASSPTIRECVSFHVSSSPSISGFFNRFLLESSTFSCCFLVLFPPFITSSSWVTLFPGILAWIMALDTAYIEETFSSGTSVYTSEHGHSCTSPKPSDCRTFSGLFLNPSIVQGKWRYPCFRDTFQDRQSGA